MGNTSPNRKRRLRKYNWSVYRIDIQMSMHDANILKFPQWWKRQVRCGYGYAQVSSLHWKVKNAIYRKETLSIWCWSLVFPAIVVFLCITFGLHALSLLAIYPLHLIKIAVFEKKRIGYWKRSIIYSGFILLNRLPLLIGQLIFVKRKILNRRHLLIEYK